jgi:hypothetical protein
MLPAQRTNSTGITKIRPALLHLPKRQIEGHAEGIADLSLF